jgi:hypothetical protein
VLIHPHSGGVGLPLGTLSVARYRFPANLYGGILYIEKKGVGPTLQSAKLGERFDLAIILGEGFPTECIRQLFARAEQDEHYRLYVLHDADIAGYSIARTLREATRLMPTHHLDVIDLGLGVEEALAMGLEPEHFTRTAALPANLALNEQERQFFTGEWLAKKKGYRASRVELNALTAPQLVGWLTAKLEGKAGADAGLPPGATVIPPPTKVVPPLAMLQQSVLEGALMRLEERERERILRELRLEEQLAALRAAAKPELEALLREVAPDLEAVVQQELAAEPTHNWSRPLGKVESALLAALDSHRQAQHDQKGGM